MAPLRLWEARRVSTVILGSKPLGAGCASWAVQTVRAFVDEFVAAVGCAARYRDFSMYGVQP